MIFDRYRVEKTLELKSELEKNYIRILIDIVMLGDLIKKQKSIYKIRLKTLEEKRVENK